MAKRTDAPMDWKFIILLFSIVLVGLSVFAISQRLSYYSSASQQESKPVTFPTSSLPN